MIEGLMALAMAVAPATQAPKTVMIEAAILDGGSARAASSVSVSDRFPASRRRVRTRSAS